MIIVPSILAYIFVKLNWCNKQQSKQTIPEKLKKFNVFLFKKLNMYRKLK